MAPILKVCGTINMSKSIQISCLILSKWKKILNQTQYVCKYVCRGTIWLELKKGVGKYYVHWDTKAKGPEANPPGLDVMYSLLLTFKIHTNKRQIDKTKTLGKQNKKLNFFLLSLLCFYSQNSIWIFYVLYSIYNIYLYR